MGFFTTHGDVFLHGLFFPYCNCPELCRVYFSRGSLSKVAGILLFFALELGNSHLGKGTQPEMATRVQEMSARPQKLSWARLCSEHCEKKSTVET